MDEVFQVLMPLESSESVYSIVYPGGAVPISGEAGDFFQVLMQQLTASLNGGVQEGMSDFLSYQLPLLASENQVMGETVSLPDGNSDGIMSDSLPFPLFAQQEETVLPDFTPFTTETGESKESVLPLIPQGEEFLVDGDFSSVEGAEAGIITQELSVIDSEGGAVVEGAHEETSQSSFSSLTRTVMMQSSIPYESSAPVDETVTTTEEMNMDALTDFVSNTGEGKEASVTDTFINLAAQEVKDEVHVPQEENAPRDVYSFDTAKGEATTYVDKDAYMQNTSMDQNAFMQFLLGKEEFTKVGADGMDLQGIAEKFFDSTIAAGNESLDTSFTATQDDTGFAASKQAMDSGGFSDETAGEEFTHLGTTDSEQTFESSLEGRIRQAQDAQLVAKQLIKSAQFRQGVNKSEFRLSLEPDYLGNLKVSIAMEGDTVITKIAADSAYTRDVVLDNLGALKDSFENAGIKFDEIEVSLDDQSSSFEFAQAEQNPYEGKTNAQNLGQMSFELPEYQVEAEHSPLHEGQSAYGVGGLYRVNFLA